MLKNLNLRVKILAAFLAVGIIPFATIGIISLLNSSKALTHQASSQLESIREMKKARIKNFFHEHKDKLGNLTETVAALKMTAYEKIQDIQTIKKKNLNEFFQSCQKNIDEFSKLPTTLDALNQLTAVVMPDGSIDKVSFEFYDENLYGINFKQLLVSHGYHDILLIEKSGTIVFSITDREDLHKSVTEGPLKDTSLGKSFPKGLKSDFIQDFQPYSPSNNEHFAYVFAPVSLSDEVFGVVAIKLKKDQVNAIVHDREGLGETGETFLVGKQDNSAEYRSDRVIGTGKLGEEVSGIDVENSLNGISGKMIRAGNTGEMKMVLFDPVDIKGLQWGIITSIGLTEAITPKLENEDKDYFAKFIERFGYHDLNLIHPNGDIFYSVAHEADFGTNIISGDYSDSGLSKLVTKVLETKAFGFADIELYAPSNGEPAAFMAQPTLIDDKVDLIVALQIPIHVINQVMHERAGMGATGETYLVGTDNRMRSDSILDSENFSVKASFKNKDKGLLNTIATQEAFDGKSGEKIITNYRGKEVLSAYSPLSIWDTTWALIAEIDVSEALQAVERMKLLTGLIAFIGVIVILFVGYLISSSITKRISYIVIRLKDIAQGEGDLTSRLEVTNKDEIGELAKWFNLFIEKLQTMIQQIAKNADDLDTSSSELSGISTHLSDGAEQMSTQTRNVSSRTDEMSSTMSGVATAMEETATNVSMVATAAEQMTATINEISHNSEEARTITNRAVDQAQDTSNKVTELGNAAQEIDKVTETITDISEQTNLLALNATIEAARAGEAGKGFAVVANEIKELARQTAEATKEIKRRIDGIKNSTEGTVEEIEQILKVINEVNEIVSTIASAVEEQSATTKDIAQNISQASSGITDVNQNVATSNQVTSEIDSEIIEVTQATGEISNSSSQVNLSAQELSNLASQLKEMVGKFKV